MKTAGVVALAFAAALLSTATCAETPLYAHVEFVDGETKIVDVAGKLRPAHVGDAIREGETLVTGNDGELHARTDDHGLVALRPRTRVKVEIYRANADAQDTSVISLVTGTLRSITGWIGRHNKDRYVIRATIGTIGVRGTDHEPMVIAATPGAIGPPGLYEKVNSGRTYISTAAGSVDVEEGRAAFAPHDAKSPPRVLDKVPEFYKPTRNEARIRERKAQLEKELEQRRLERQKERALALEKEKAAAAAEKEKAAADEQKSAAEKAKAASGKPDASEKADDKREAAEAKPDSAAEDRKEQHKKTRKHHPPQNK